MPECRIERQSEHEADYKFTRSDFQSGYGERCELAALDRGKHHYLKSDYDGVEYNRHKRREHPGIAAGVRVESTVRASESLNCTGP